MTASKRRTNYEEKREITQREKIDARKDLIMERLSDAPAKAATFHQERGYRDQSVTIDSLIELRKESKIIYNNVHKAWAKKKQQ